MAESERMIENAALLRHQLLEKLFDPRRDIDDEAGYSKTVTADQYRGLYDREGISTRVVQVLPESCWETSPAIIENEEAEETEFERTWNDLDAQFNLWSWLERIDKLSGVGHYGVLLFGLDDGGRLEDPVEGVNADGSYTQSPSDRRLLYLRSFDESLVTVNRYEVDESNPRFGQPVEYTVQFGDPRTREAPAFSSISGSTETTERRVHWSRILHVADNRESSETFGVPRMRPVYNRLYDLRKILGGSGEMFWRGAFPGISFELQPGVSADNAEIDLDATKDEVEKYMNSMQRYLALSGLTANQLAPQIADPTAHVKVNLMAIAITLGVPMRVFMGSEAAELASSQDSETWNRRLGRRREKYITPYIIRPFVSRLIGYGVLPQVERYDVQWEDLEQPGEMEQAEVATKWTEAITKYIAGNADTLIPPMEYMVHILGMEPERAESILKAAMERMREEEDDFVEDEDDEPTPPNEEEDDGEDAGT